MTLVGLPHSEISASEVVCTYTELIAAYHVLLRLSVPRHPPCALSSLIENLQLHKKLEHSISALNCAACWKIPVTYFFTEDYEVVKEPLVRRSGPKFFIRPKAGAIFWR
jgi:hypothetical protein